MPEQITVKQAANILELTARRVRQLCQAGILQATKPGRDWLIDRDNVLEYKERQKR